MPITEVDRATGLATGAAYKAPVYLATTANITLSGEQTIDGVLTDESRVLVKDQSDAAENGIYVSSTGDWVRAPDLSRNDSIREGTRVWVTDGSTNSATEFVITSADPISIDTSDIVWARAVDLAPTSDFGDALHAAAGVAALEDADEFAIWNSLTTALGKVTWANIKTLIIAALGPLIAGVTGKTTPVDADTVLLSDSAASAASKSLTWANIKATIFAAIGGLLAAATSKSTPIDADGVLVYDSAASNATKRLTWANLKATLKAYFDTLYEASGGGDGGWTYASQIPTSDVTAVTFTGLSAYRTIEFDAAFMSDGSTGGVNVDARVSGGTWREIANFAGSLGSGEWGFVSGRIVNFNQLAGKLTVAHYGDNAATLDASNAVNHQALDEGTGSFAAYAEVWDEIRFRSNGFEGSTVDQRGLFVVRGL